MSFGWMFLIYLAIGFVVRLIVTVVANYKAYKNKTFSDNAKESIGELDELIEDHAQQYNNPQVFRFLLAIFGYILWPIDVAGLAYTLFRPKE